MAANGAGIRPEWGTELSRKISGSRRSLAAIGKALTILSALVISGCGPLSDDDEREEPLITVEPSAESKVGTPESVQDLAPEATPDVDGIVPDDTAKVTVDDATPQPSRDDSSKATAEARSGEVVSPITTSNLGDGTSGATPSLGTADGSSDDDPETDDGTTTPATETVVVTSCTSENVPESTGESDAFVVAEDLNVRIGPGSDCEVIGDGPLLAGEAITVLSDPVVRDGENEVLWVRVELPAGQGWVALEFIEPAP